MAGAKKGIEKSGYDAATLQLLMQKLADAAQEIDIYTFSNEVPVEHSRKAKEVVAEVNKLCNAALARKPTKIQVQLG